MAQVVGFMFKPSGKPGLALQALIDPPPVVKLTESLAPDTMLKALCVGAVRVGAGGKALLMVKAIEKSEIPEVFLALNI